MITRDKFLEETGIPYSTFRGWMGTRLKKGVHYFVIGRTMMVDPEAIDLCIRNSSEECDHMGTASRSDGNGKANDIPNRLPKCQIRQILPMPQRLGSSE